MSGSTPCPLCGTLNGPGETTCGACGLSLREAASTNAGGAKCARCGSAMPSGFDFCPVCGQDQRERWRRPPTESLQILPGGGQPGAPAPPAMQTPFGAVVQSPVGASPAVRGGADRTVPAPYYPAQDPAAQDPSRRDPAFTPTLDRTYVPGANPGMSNRSVPQAHAMPPIVSERVTDDDATVPARGARLPISFEDAAFGPGGSAASDDALDDSKTIPFITLQQRQQLAQMAAQAGPSMTIPAIFVEARPADAHTRPDRPGGFSGGPTGEAPPDGVNVAQRSEAALASHGQPSRLPTYPGMAPARLVLVARDGTEGESFPFLGQAITVGRTHGDILFPEDPFLSPVHVRLTRTGTGILLTDTGSTNGVYLRIGRVAPVFPGDMFMIGHQLLRLDQLDSQAQEHPPGVDGTRLFGTPLQPAWGRVTQLGRGGVAGDHMYLRGSRVSFGREGGDLVFPNDPFVSREHARLRLEITGQAMAVLLEDVGSANGTYVRIRGAAEIGSGDTFRVGDQILKLRLD